MNAEERTIINLLSCIEGATVEQSRWWGHDRTIVVRTPNMADCAQVEVRGREVSIRPSSAYVGPGGFYRQPHRVRLVGVFRGRGWKVALNAAVRGAIRDTETAYGHRG